MLKKHVQCLHGCYEGNLEGSLQFFLEKQIFFYCSFFNVINVNIISTFVTHL